MKTNTTKYQPLYDKSWGNPSGTLQKVHRPDKRIFISYRRKDSAESTGRLNDHLSSAFSVTIFQDIHSISGGEDFFIRIKKELSSTDLVIAIIGPEWLKITDDEGNYRLTQPDDYVRLEIETALKKKTPLIPVLINNALMPKASELPESIRELARKSAKQLRPDPDFLNDFEALSMTIRSYLGLPSKPNLDEVINEIVGIVEYYSTALAELRGYVDSEIDQLEGKTSDRHSELIMAIQTIGAKLNSIKGTIHAQQQHSNQLDRLVGELLRHNRLL